MADQHSVLSCSRLNSRRSHSGAVHRLTCVIGTRAQLRSACDAAAYSQTSMRFDSKSYACRVCRAQRRKRAKGGAGVIKRGRARLTACLQGRADGGEQGRMRMRDWN